MSKRVLDSIELQDVADVIRFLEAHSSKNGCHYVRTSDSDGVRINVVEETLSDGSKVVDFEILTDQE